MLALPTASSGERITQMLRKERMLIGDPLGEGSNASSTDNELWRAENSFLRMRRNAPFFFLSWLSRKFPPNLGQVEFTVVTLELERNKRACLTQ